MSKRVKDVYYKHKSWDAFINLKLIEPYVRRGGYEPDELPLLYLALWLQMYVV